MTPPAPPIIDSLDCIADRYDALFCDLWGCLHDGVRIHREAAEALRRFRAGGGVVVLMTNAPRPAFSVARHLGRLGASEDLRDSIVSSGDASIRSVNAGEWGRRVYHIGAEKDEAFFEVAQVERVPMPDAESVICTGLRDDRTETPEDYRDELREAQLRGLPMLSANPDIHVDVGGRRAWCAGGLAQLFEALGGRSRSYGKPHAPIYDLGRRQAESALGRPLEDSRILCIGDGIATDIAGGVAEGLDTLFVAGGLGAAELCDDSGDPQPERLTAYAARHRVSPTFAIGRLR
jgi:HAD superfamily hydrolase (TIGR01459 family)